IDAFDAAARHDRARAVRAASQLVEQRRQRTRHVNAVGCRGELDELRRRSHGAVASLSGRGIDSIDAFLNMSDLPVAGLHGAERSDANVDTQRTGVNDARLLRIDR
ncbi:hypothetical protein DN546_38185, partial [Burkholderia multivorans]